MTGQAEAPRIDDPLGDTARALDLLTKRTRGAIFSATMLKDRAIAEALAEVQPLWTSEEIRRRCVIMRSVGDSRDTLFVDGIAVLVFEEPAAVQEWKADELVVTIRQKFRRIQAVNL